MRTCHSFPDVLSSLGRPWFLMFAVAALFGCDDGTRHGTNKVPGDAAASHAPPSSSDRAPSPPNATAGRAAMSEPSQQIDPCAVLAERLEVVWRHRHEPQTLFRGSGNRPHVCETEVSVCGRALVDELGFFGVAFPKDGPGAAFYFELLPDASERRLDCVTFGLQSFKSARDTDVCRPISGGPLRGMTVTVNNSCERLRVRVFDDGYAGADRGAATFDDCSDQGRSHARVEALRCPSLPAVSSRP
jgi:hypothetical protein